MENLSIIILFLFVLFTLLGSGVWVGLALMGVAWVGMELFTSRPVGFIPISLAARSLPLYQAPQRRR